MPRPSPRTAQPRTAALGGRLGAPTGRASDPSPLDARAGALALEGRHVQPSQGATRGGRAPAAALPTRPSPPGVALPPGGDAGPRRGVLRTVHGGPAADARPAVRAGFGALAGLMARRGPEGHVEPAGLAGSAARLERPGPAACAGLAVLAASATLAALAGPAAAQERPVLTVYAYDSFTTEFGPGAAIEAAFEPLCGCDLRIVGAGDGAALLARLRLEGERTEADVVMGFDTDLMARAEGLMIPHGVEAAFDLPVAWNDPVFLPFDWSWLAFVHRTDLEPPTSFRALAESDVQVVIQDPRSSTPGLATVLWVDEAYGEEADAIWEGLADNILTVTKGWSEAYGLFIEGEADMVMSYTTSPAYHLIAEDDPTVKAAPFEEGHYLQIELASIVATTDQPELAREFMAFVVSDAFQSLIATGNWSYPAVTPEEGLPEGFETLHRPEKSLLVPPDEAGARAEEAIATWRDALSR